MSGTREPPRITIAEPAPIEGDFEIRDERGRVLALVPLRATDGRHAITEALRAALARREGA